MSTNYNYDRLEHFNTVAKEFFVVNWCMGNTCNFSCSYCPVYLHNASKAWHPIENVKKLSQFIQKLQPDKKLYIEFTGGEVTLHRDFVSICKWCKENQILMGFITNGSRTLRWWNENLPYFYKIIMSYHASQINKEHFLNVVKLLHTCNHINLHINVMMDPQNWENCLSVAETIRDLGNCSIALQPLLHNLETELYPYTSEQMNILVNQYDLISKHIKWTKKNEIQRGAMKTVKEDGSYNVRTAHSFISRNTNNWYGWQCYAGVEQLVVDMDGDIYRGWCKAGGPITNLSQLNFGESLTPIICNQTKCHCNFDIMTTKIKVKREAA